MIFIRYLKKTLKQGIRNGVELASEKLEELKVVKKRISELAIK